MHSNLFQSLRAPATAGIVAVLASLASHGADAADAKGNYAVWGVGAKSCFAFKQAATEGTQDTYRQFVMGYLTAYNAIAADTYRIEGRMSLDDIMAWIADYCDAQQMHSFEQALADFTAQNADKRMKSAPMRQGR